MALQQAVLPLVVLQLVVLILLQLAVLPRKLQQAVLLLRLQRVERESAGLAWRLRKYALL